jgi:hypothetical protein
MISDTIASINISNYIFGDPTPKKRNGVVSKSVNSTLYELLDFGETIEERIAVKGGVEPVFLLQTLQREN